MQDVCVCVWCVVCGFILFHFFFSGVKIVIKIIVHFNTQVTISASVFTDKAGPGFGISTFFLNFLQFPVKIIIIH
jgi:hypothetical protein